MKDTLKQWQAFIPLILCAAYTAIELLYQSRKSALVFSDLLLLFLFVGAYSYSLAKQQAQLEARIVELETRIGSG